MTARWLTVLAVLFLGGPAHGAAQGPQVLRKVVDLTGHEGRIVGALCDADAKEIVTWSTTDGTMRFWNHKTGAQKEILTINLQVRVQGQPDTENKVKLFTVMPWNKNTWLFHSTIDMGFGVWDRTKRKFGTFYKLPNRPVLAHHAKGPEAVIILQPTDDRNSGPLVLSDVKSLKQLRRLTGLKSPAKLAQFSPDGKRLLTYSPGDQSLRLWDVATGQQGKRLGKEEAVTSFAFTSDSKQIVTGGDVLCVWDAATAKELRRIELPEGHTVAPGGQGVAVSPDGKRVLAITHKGKTDWTLRLFDLETGNLLARADLKYDAVDHQADRSVLFTADGERFLTYGGLMSEEGRRLKTATLWELPAMEDKP